MNERYVLDEVFRKHIIKELIPEGEALANVEIDISVRRLLVLEIAIEPAF